MVAMRAAPGRKHMNSTDAYLYSAGDCQICLDSGNLALLVSVADHSMLYVCPMCMVSWRSSSGVGDGIHDIKVAAPSGLRLPTATEVQAVIANGTPLEGLPFRTWMCDIVENLVEG